MKDYAIIMRESKSGINLRVKPAKRRHPFGFEELGCSIPAEDLPGASSILKAIVKNCLTRIYKV